jgi:hypothetical protein
MVDTNVPLPLLPAHIEGTNSIYRSAPRRAPPERHADSARRRSHNSLSWPPPIHRRADRHRGRLDQPESARRRDWLSLSIRLPSLGWEARSHWCRSTWSSILATQQREYQLAQLREQLTLELAILSEQKTAKVIQLLEESRRDNPLIRNRVDQEAEAMAQPADPQSVLDAIKETHAGAEQISGGADGH